MKEAKNKTITKLFEENKLYENIVQLKLKSYINSKNIIQGDLYYE